MTFITRIYSGGKALQEWACGCTICDSQGLYLADDSEYGPYAVERINLRLIRVCGGLVAVEGYKRSFYGALVARLDSICPDGCEHDIHIFLSRSK